MAVKNTSPSPSRAVLEVHDAKELVQGIVEQLKEKLPTKCSMRVSTIVTGGSLGLGTSYLGRFDSELIIYSTDVDTKEIEKKGYGNWLSKIHQLFQTDEVLSESYDFHEVTEWTLQFGMEGVEMELMVSPCWGRPGNFYTFLETIKSQHRSRFNLCAGKWQVQFLKQQPNQRQDYRLEFISRAKAWREQKWSQSTGGEGRPSSYLLSLLVLKAYEDALKKLGVFSSLSPDTMAYQTSEELKRIVSNHTTIDIWWEHCYSLKQYPTLIPPRPPRIVDPANPANNLYKTGITSFKPHERQGEHKVGGGDWTVLKRHIGSLDLTKPAQYWI